MQFVVLPMTIVAILVGFFVLGGVLFGGSEKPEDYLNRIRTQSGREAWQAAYELSVLLAKDDKVRKDSALAESVARIFQESQNKDVQLRRYLALALGQMASPGTTSILVEALKDGDPETRGYVVWALGAAGARSAVPHLLPQLKDADAGIRKVTAYTLGHLRAEEAALHVLPLLNDVQSDVQWNAAIALAQMGRRDGLPILLQMLDREYLVKVPDLSEAQRRDAMISALKAVGLLRVDESRPIVDDVSRRDPDLKVREIALRVLEQWGS
jgi:HEAT repeat protein